MASAAERDVGQFPLSIGTSLALEGSLGIHPDRPIGADSAQTQPHAGPAISECCRESAASSDAHRRRFCLYP